MTAPAPVQTRTPSAAAWNVPIEGMDCADCAKTIEQSLGDMPGVQSARVQFAAGKAEVSYDSRQIGPVELGKRVRELGYSVREETAAMWVFDVGGMDCADCARTVESGVSRLPGVANAQVNFAAATLSVLPAAANLSKQQVILAVEQAGYEAHVRGGSEQTSIAAPWWRRRRIGEIALSAVLWLLGFGLEHNGFSTVVTAVPFLAAMGLAGYPVARAAWFSIKARRADMNLLMTVAAVGAIAIGEWDEGSSVLILFAIGITLQNLTLDRTRRAIQALLKLAPAEATVRRDGVEQRVLVSSITVGETLIVRAGDRLPLDGVVISGYSAVDQAPITGESVPVDIAPGASVFAGSINGDGVLELQTTKLASDTMLARIGRMVEEAQASKAPAQAFVDRFAAIYTPIVIGVAVLLATVVPLITGDFHEWFFRALVLLVVACPCALVISTPVALVSAIGSASIRGVLFKGGAAIEGLASIRAIAFDKTGTLTAGRPVVTDVVPFGNIDASTLLGRAAAVESQSTHPIASAILQAASDQKLSLPAASALQNAPGRGTQAMIETDLVRIGSRRMFADVPDEIEQRLSQLEEAGKTAILIGTDRGIEGIIAVTDPLRKESAQVIRELSTLGIQSVMLTGDNRHTANRIAEQTGVTDVHAELLPEGKVSAIRELELIQPTGMIGDGVNDAPALASATIGIAMGGGGTDVAIEAADVALMRDDLQQVPASIRLARKTVAIIQQNVVVSIAVKAVFLGLTFTGVTNLWLAVLADTGMSLLVTANSLRLLRFERASSQPPSHSQPAGIATSAMPAD